MGLNHMFLKLKGFLKNHMIELLNKSPKILVIGDLMIDHYLWGSSKRISPQAPVPVMTAPDQLPKFLGEVAPGVGGVDYTEETYVN